MYSKISSELDRIANSLEQKGLIKEAMEIDVISNTIEKQAMGGLLGNLIAKIPGASQIRTKEQAFGILMDAAKKLGVKKVTQAIDFAIRTVSQQPSMDQREASYESNLNSFIRSFGYPILVIASLLLAYWIGAPQLESFKAKMEKTIQNSQQQQAINEILQTEAR